MIISDFIQKVQKNLQFSVNNLILIKKDIFKKFSIQKHETLQNALLTDINKIWFLM